MGEPTPEIESFIDSAQVAQGMRLIIDEQVRAHFPEATIGYVVADLPAHVKPVAGTLLTDAVKSLRGRGVTAENLTMQPEIAVWRAAFKTFGVKPSKYLCSAEALAKRALKDKPAEISPVVDAYNAISIKYLIPMGALDLDKLHGDLTVRYGRAGETASLLGFDGPVVVEATHVVYADQERVVTWLWNHRDAVETAVNNNSSRVIFLADSLLGETLAKAAIDELASLLQGCGATVVTQGFIGRVAA
jgi:lysyl-tRNA synthetase class 2